MQSSNGLPAPAVGPAGSAPTSRSWQLPSLFLLRLRPCLWNWACFTWGRAGLSSWRKRAVLPKSIHWHLVGHLQRNKIERTLPVHLIHSVDRISLLSALDEEASNKGLEVDALLEVNASGERTKMGFSPEEVSAAVPEIAKLKRVRVKGLMTMAAPFADPQQCRPAFTLLRSLRDELRSRPSSSARGRSSLHGHEQRF